MNSRLITRLLMVMLGVAASSFARAITFKNETKYHITGFETENGQTPFKLHTSGSKKTKREIVAAINPVIIAPNSSAIFTPSAGNGVVLELTISERVSSVGGDYYASHVLKKFIRSEDYKDVMTISYNNDVMTVK